jgi:hypothetical protein
MAQEIRRWVSPGGEEETKRAQTQRTFSNQLMTAVKSKVLYLRSTFCADESEVGEGLRIRGGGDLPFEPGEKTFIQFSKSRQVLLHFSKFRQVLLHLSFNF